MPEEKNTRATGSHGTSRDEDVRYPRGGWSADDRYGPDWPGGPQGGGGGGWPRNRRLQPLTVALIAVLAAVAGAVLVLIITKGPSGPSSVANPGTVPSAAAPSPGAQNGPAGGFPGGLNGGGQTLFMGGVVTAVSSHSITLGGQGHTVTAAITSSTRFTGQVKSASDIKPGDLVAAQITGYGSHPVAVVIQDPAQIP